MDYYDPKEVLTPRKRITKLQPIMDTGSGGFSAAVMRWDGDLACGVRWNHGSGVPGQQSLGNPQSHANPTWFIIPGPLEIPVLLHIRELLDAGEAVKTIDVEAACLAVDEYLLGLGYFTGGVPVLLHKDKHERAKQIEKMMRDFQKTSENC
jgi:hypothetical protein